MVGVFQLQTVHVRVKCGCLSASSSAFYQLQHPHIRILPPAVTLYGRAQVKCELRNCEWVFCELKCEPACDWSAIFRTTRSLPDANAIAHSRNFRTGNKTCILAHITRVYFLYAMYATITVVINIKKEPVHHLL